jgi:hypothetical protein
MVSLSHRPPRGYYLLYRSMYEEGGHPDMPGMPPPGNRFLGNYLKTLIERQDTGKPRLLPFLGFSLFIKTYP